LNKKKLTNVALRRFEVTLKGGKQYYCDFVTTSLKDVYVFSSYYDATVDSISDDLTTCTVSFEKYGNTEIVKVRQSLIE